jgi:hypothetical protein
MQHFTVLHDGSGQGWQAAYLAFHIASRLGAPLRALLFESSPDKKALMQKAAQVEVGARAADVAVETRLIPHFSVADVAENSKDSNGLFIPRHLVSDENAARQFLEALSYPIWLVSMESTMNGMAMLIGDPDADEAMTHYATVLSKRIQLSLTGFAHKNEIPLISKPDEDIAWQPLIELTPVEITAALKRVDASLLFLSISQFSLTDELPVNCVIYPAPLDA